MTYVGKNKKGGCEECKKLTSCFHRFNGLEFCSKNCAINYLFKKMEQNLKQKLEGWENSDNKEYRAVARLIKDNVEEAVLEFEKDCKEQFDLGLPLQDSDLKILVLKHFGNFYTSK